MRVTLASLLAMLIAACGPHSPSPTQGDADNGRLLLRQFGCGACHVIPGVRAARGVVGPTLNGFARRPHLAGKWPNHPDRLVAWLRDPPGMAPHTAMPAVVEDAQSARDIAAYLYTLD